jgi:hypothetical protein
MSFRTSALGLVVVLGVTVSAAAQQGTPLPLGDVARQAEAAKATVKKAKKTYTNADLNPDPNGPPLPPPPRASGFMSSSLATPVTSKEMVARSEQTANEQGREQQPESYWRVRADALRAQVSRLQTMQALLQKPDEKRSSAAQAMNDGELAKVQQGLDGLRKQWARLEAAGSEAKIPNEWLDPRPQQ